MKPKVDVKVLLNKGAYFGHKISRTNPKVLPYTYKAQNGIYLIDLFKTKECIETTINSLFLAGQNNETLLLVASKRIIKQRAHDLAQEANIFHMAEKWVGGFLTNFPEISKNIKKANEYFAAKKAGEWDKMLKHERAKLERELFKLDKVYNGVLNKNEIPQNIIIVDTRKEINALKEALTIKEQYEYEAKGSLTIYGIVDTNTNPELVDLPIVMNDDSSLALEYVLGLLIKAYSEGANKQKKIVSKKIKKTDETNRKAKKTKK